MNLIFSLFIIEMNETNVFQKIKKYIQLKWNKGYLSFSGKSFKNFIRIIFRIIVIIMEGYRNKISRLCEHIIK